MFVQQEIAGKASAHPASGRPQGVFDGRARMLRPFSSNDAARTSSPDWARGTHAVTAPGDAVLVRGVYRREWAWRALSEAGSLSYARRGAATRITAFHQGRARLGSGESPEAAPGWAPRMLSRVAAARAASIKPEPPRSVLPVSTGRCSRALRLHCVPSPAQSSILHSNRPLDPLRACTRTAALAAPWHHNLQTLHTKCQSCRAGDEPGWWCWRAARRRSSSHARVAP
jgi:hypothetical protein